MNIIKELFGNKRKFGSKQVKDVCLCVFDIADGKYKVYSANDGNCLLDFETETEMDAWITTQKGQAEQVAIAKVVYPLFSSKQ